MARSQKKHDRVAFIACTSLALGIIVVMWVWSVRSVVGAGVQGTKQIYSDVSDVAGEARRQTTPDPATVAAIKAGIMKVVTKKQDPSSASGSSADASTTDSSTIDAVAQLMKNDVETYGQEPKN